MPALSLEIIQIERATPQANAGTVTRNNSNREQGQRTINGRKIQVEHPGLPNRKKMNTDVDSCIPMGKTTVIKAVTQPSTLTVSASQRHRIDLN
jgi:hypothetical protein